MRFGYFNQLQMPRPWNENSEAQLYKNAMEQAVHAEAVGFDYYWATEHHFYSEIGHSSSPEVFLAALAQHTSKIRLGFGVVVLPCNHPYRVVEYVSTLDILSDGRVELGTGRGASSYHTEAFGYSKEETSEMWEESMRVICPMFMDDPFPGWNGRYYKDLPGRDMVPKPIQKPHPPLWLAAQSPSTFARAARLGLGVLGFGASEPDEMIPAIRAYREAVSECEPIGGYANHNVATFNICNIDKDYGLGRDKACAAARWYFGENDSVLQKQRRPVPDAVQRRSNDQLIEDGLVIGGDVDSVCRSIERWQSLGLDQLLFMIQAGNTTHDDVMRALDLLGSKVLPRFQEPASATKPSVAKPQSGDDGL